MKRSTLNRILLLWTLTWVIMLLAGCTTSWVSEATNVIALLGPAISSILAIISAFGLGLSPAVATALQSWSTDAETALQQVATLINQYNAAEATAQPGILVEIQTLLGVISNNLSTILPTIKVENAIVQAKIEAIVEAFQAELSSLIALVPALQAAVEAGGSQHDQLKYLVNHGALGRLKTGQEFKADFNAKILAFGPTAEQYKLK
jgi:hypothetical protein